MFMTAVVLMLCNCTFADQKDQNNLQGTEASIPTVNDNDNDFDFDYYFTQTSTEIPTTIAPATTTTTTTTTTTIAPTTTTTTRKTTAKPVNEIKQCGLNKDSICVKRAECSTDRTNNRRIVIDLDQPSLSGCHYLEACCHPDNMLRPDDLPIALEFEQCGASNVGGLFMTVKGGDVESSFAEFPWTVAILNENQELVCNGALISDQVILTAATCVAPKKPLIVRAGDWDLMTEKEPVPHETRAVKTRIIHQQFNWVSTEHNIALLILEKALPHLRHIIPVCLDNGNTELDYENCFISGWHVNRFKPTSFSTRDIVLKIKMDLKSKSCPDSTSKDLCGYMKTDRPVMPKGAPLVCPTEDNKYHLVGTKNVGLNTTSFANISEYSEWIKEELARHNIKIKGL
ncbi:hypothetical protein KR059_009133 [Drosophila kikkawai]|nr:hypothetical protein KR059_009133 [Drosophila kikkawai]